MHMNSERIIAENSTNWNNQNIITIVKVDTDHYRPSRRGGVARKCASSPESWNYPDKYFTTHYNTSDLKKEYDEIKKDINNPRLKEIEIKIKENDKYIKSIDRSRERYINKKNKK